MYIFKLLRFLQGNLFYFFSLFALFLASFITNKDLFTTVSALRLFYITFYSFFLFSDKDECKSKILFQFFFNLIVVTILHNCISCAIFFSFRVYQETM